MNVAVFGLGYVGCVTASCLAREGHEVVGVDVSEDKVAMVNAGQAPILEPGLSELLARVVQAGCLSATVAAAEAVERSEIVLISVGTPDLGRGQQDLEALARVATAIGGAIRGRARPLTVVIRSTVLPGTSDRVLARILQEGEISDPRAVRIAVNPEFMREGSSLEDFDHPPFILVGCSEPVTAMLIRRLYGNIDAPFLQTGVKTAEMVKYACNAFHALKICFANEIADLCDALGADGQEVMRIVCEDRRLNVSPAYLKPGFAFGGSCLPKDLRTILGAGRLHDVAVPLLTGIIPSNDGRVRRAIQAVIDTKRRRVGVVGLTFKPKTDDLRESPMVALVEALIGKGCDVRIYDPTVVVSRLRGANRSYIETEIPHIASLLCESPEALVDHADVLVVGSAGPQADRVLRVARTDQTIVDLTRGALRVSPRTEPAKALTPAEVVHATSQASR